MCTTNNILKPNITVFCTHGKRQNAYPCEVVWFIIVCTKRNINTSLVFEVVLCKVKKGYDGFFMRKKNQFTFQTEPCHLGSI